MSITTTVFSAAMLLAALLAGCDAPAPAETKPGEPSPGDSQPAESPRTMPLAAPDVVEDDLKPLAKDYDVWFDPQRKLVVVDGKVCLREGLLEMFACPTGTKEHESIVAVNCPARFIHTALLAVGAKSGTAVRFDPDYAPASGTTIDVWVFWKDKDGKQKAARAQEWIQHTKTSKAMDYDWVFAGSGFWVDETTGERHYHGDSGDFICVSNFPTATLDLPVVSPQANDDLFFRAFTERIPPQDTPVRLVLVPRIEKERKNEEPEKSSEQ